MKREVIIFLDKDQQAQLDKLATRALAANEAGEPGMILAQIAGDTMCVGFVNNDDARRVQKTLNPELPLDRAHPKPSTQRFFSMLDRVPRLVSLWCREAEELRIDAFDNALPVMSTGEYLMAKFFASVWFGNGGRYAFDVVEAMSHLDEHNQKIILDWVADPFYP